MLVEIGAMPPLGAPAGEAPRQPQSSSAPAGVAVRDGRVVRQAEVTPDAR